MTTNQLKWAEIKENIRHNVATEGVESRKLVESVRHNTEAERANFMQAAASQQQAAAATRQASVAAYNADIRNYEAAIADRRANFDEVQYWETGKAETQARTDLMSQQAQTEVARSALVNEQAYQAQFYSSIQPFDQAVSTTGKLVGIGTGVGSHGAGTVPNAWITQRNAVGSKSN